MNIQLKAPNAAALRPLTGKVSLVTGSTSGIGLGNFTGEQIRDGQQRGSVWGHSAYVAPDWRTLHLERYELLTPTQRASVDALVEQEIRANTFDAGSRGIAME